MDHAPALKSFSQTTIQLELPPEAKAKIALLKLWEKISEYQIILLGNNVLTEAQERHNQRVSGIHARLQARIIKKYGAKEGYL
jgi:hypothetical protein